jgi:hypothetical protein
MNRRRLSRGQARVLRAARYWPTRLQAAPSAADQAAVAFDWVRTRIAALPWAEQDAAWAALVEQLSGIARGAANSHVNSHGDFAVNSGPTDRRARTRARETGPAIVRYPTGHGDTN